MKRLLALLVLLASGTGCVMSPAQPGPVSPRPAPPSSDAPTQHGGEADVSTSIIATWEVVAVADATCQLAPVDAPIAAHVGLACAADTPVGARVLKMSDGVCSLIHPRPDCGPGRICDPRPAQEVPCPGAP
ncbi:MAG: hypothetical protein IPL79_15910 [Myxococcales bacterium]|nr:hypothetical protein [Myxococcales bacterium]